MSPKIRPCPLRCRRLRQDRVVQVLGAIPCFTLTACSQSQPSSTSSDTRDENHLQRDRAFYPEIPDPPHLEHYFVGNVVREVNAVGVQQGNLWTVDLLGAQWCGGAMGWNTLYWLQGSSPFRRPSVRWRFSPSVRLDDGSRLVSLTIQNPTNTPIEGQFWMYTLGSRLLEGAPLRQWRTQNQPNVQRSIALGARQALTLQFTLPAGTPNARFFYGEFELLQRGLPATSYYFAHQEADAPALTGYMGSEGANRPAQVQISSSSGSGVTKTVVGNANGVWQVVFQTGDEALFADSAFYTPSWQVRVKPQGALSQTFNNVLLPGSDPIDPYLRMQLVLGDVNGDDCIDDADLLQVLFNFGESGGSLADLNLDGVVDDADLLLVLFNFGAGC